jgi:tetratricopeptide (TPR) repeat protein
MSKFLTIIKLSVTLFCLLFFTSVSFAQISTPFKGQKNIVLAKLTEKDKKAHKKLSQMSQEEVKELDKKLANALTLFYDREYAKSLAIFKEIASQVETMDIMFWLGQSAMKVGETELATKKFTDMLDIDPTLHRVRLELATCYFQIGRYDDARDELSAVLKAEPPEAVRKNILKLLAAIDERARKVFINLRLSQSIQKDTNISSGPEEERIPVSGGTLLLTKKQRELEDWVTVTNFYGNILYDVGARNGLAWNTTGSFYRSHCFDYYEFGFLQGGATTGPWLIGKRSILKLPIGYSYSEYGHEHLFDTTSFSPSYEYHFTNYFSLRGFFSHRDEKYAASDKEGYDSVNRIYELSPSFYFNNRQDMITLAISHENSNARLNRHSFEARHYSISYFKRILKDMEFFARYRYTDREFDTKPLLYTKDRKDTRHSFYAVLSRNFLKYYFASLYYNYISDDSNADLYDFDRNIYGLSVGVKF